MAIDAIISYKAKLAYHAIVEELVKNLLLWDGPIIVLGQTDHHVAEVIERNLPIKLGRSSSAKRGERTFISEWSFSSVLQGLGNRKSFVAIGEEEHALTITSAYGKVLQFVDPQYPENLIISPAGLFHPKLDPNGDGKIDATLVSRANGK